MTKPRVKKVSPEESFLATARKRFQVAVDASSDNRVHQLDDVRFAAGSPDNGWQWPEKIRDARMNDKNGPRPVLTENVLPQHIKQVTNEQRQNRPGGKVIPVDDKGDPEVAKLFNGIVRHIEVASHADVAYDGACEAQVTSGEGYWRLLTEYCDEQSFEQDILIGAIRNPFSVYMDPDGLKRDSTGRKCAWGFITDRMTTDDYEATFPDAKSKADWDNLALGDDTFQWFDDTGVMIAEYFSFRSETKKLYLWPNGVTTIEGDNLPPDIPIGTLPVKERETEIRRVWWAKINGAEILEESEWAGKFIPIIRVAGNEFDVEGKLVVSGLVRNTKDPQRMVNYWVSQEAEMLALAPKAPFVGAAGQFEGFEDKWRDANVVNYAYLEYNPQDINGSQVPPPTRQPPPMPPAGFINAKLGAMDAIKSVTGQYDPTLGNNPQAKSGIALQREQKKSEVGTFHYIDNLSRSICYSTEQIVDLIPKIYDTRRVLRIVGEDGETEHAVLNPGQGQAVMEEQDDSGAIRKVYDPSVGRYDVVVVVGPSFTTKRTEAVDGMLTMTQANPNLWGVIGDLLVKSMDWPGADEMAERIRKSLPAELTADENTNANDIAAQQQKVRAAVQQIGQREAELNAHAEGLQQASEQAAQETEQAKAATQQAKDAMAKIAAEIAKLNELQAAVENERQLLDLRKQLAEKEIQIDSTTLASEKAVATAEMKVLEERMKTKLAEINDAQTTLEATTQTTDGVKESVSQIIAELKSDIAKVEKLAGAERELILDEQGEPIGSRPVMSDMEMMQ